MVDALTLSPTFSSSPWIRLVAPAGVLPRHLLDQRRYSGANGRPLS